MHTKILIFSLLAILSYSCIEKVEYNPNDDNVDSDYAEKFNNRKTITVNISSVNSGEYVSIYFSNPYNDEMLCKQPSLSGFTPINTSLDIPKEVTQLYVIMQGEMKTYRAEDITITPNSFALRSSDNNAINADVMTVVNSIYFPEKTNNIRGENLFKCTDLEIAETPSSDPFETAEVWLTFLGDGGCRQSKLYGKLWFYTYPAAKQNSLTFDDCTFYGVKDNEVAAISFNEMKNQKNWVFYTLDEFKSNIASYKRYKLGEFPKGINIGFVYIGNSMVGNDGFRFTTPALNPKVQNFTLSYLDKQGSYYVNDNYVANGYICHVKIGDFTGNILGMENRLVNEEKYDGDYNDILCLIESNPKTIKPSEDVTIGNSDKPEDVACKTTTGIYMFEDNYPDTGDFDFNDAVILYEIKDYYQSKNKAKQVTVRTLAYGASMTNDFGFNDSNGFQCLLPNLKGYKNVYPNEKYTEIGSPVVQTLYGDIQPCLKTEKNHYIHITNYNTEEYPCVLDIPISDPNDVSWKFLWPLEMQSIDNGYFFRKNENGEKRNNDWYKIPKNNSLLFQR